ncbi:MULTISPECIES: sialic acid TRAP transporter substrate-binding protein SiaP [unclassified Rhizobacter]|uniref:sialic acid TRAP transporter substrate-binding protein SiaP n=1 Tax=unclassified Rhizobacter TaxID=2640088 RepID=UPI0006FFD2D0|nr:MULTISPECIES: sialic acid TRAP transporter substrate-binding protein SiaP [unclassified Rhizobacter]KQU81703.1 ABC transporter substrate-binding protein [Rhizobacter sp. Root29]KQW12155.1 ABC transporter substrate-binding protein [Rhizobacter sp. Root1238]KRB03101.1 ABC transporter substrate-binding protein [Rhizobacter sp. Root16D2]
MKLTTVLTQFASIAVLALCSTAGLAQTKLKWAHVYETSEPYHKQALWAAEEIRKRSNGKYLIDVFPASTLGKETDINQGLTLGTVDIIYTGMAFAGRAYPPLSIASGPFIFRDHAHWQSFRDSPIFKELASGYESKSGGNHIVGYTYYGQRHLTANKQVLKPEDMKGMKLRVPDAPLYMMFPRAVGANPTPIAFAEVYLALQNGTVDAQENPLPTIEAKKFYEVQKYTMLTGHITESLLTIVSGAAWGKLPADDRKLFEQVLWEASTRSSNDILESENRMVADFEKAGRTIVKVDRKPFMQAVQKAVTAPDAPWSKELYDRVEALK